MITRLLAVTTLIVLTLADNGLGGVRVGAVGREI